MKKRVAVIFGGKSAEHQVSLQSANNVIKALDKTKYEPILIGIDKKGVWHQQKKDNYLINESNPKLIALNESKNLVATIPEKKDRSLINISNNEKENHIDIVFPVLHGPFGEDGTIQGMLKLMDVPFVGSGLLGSAIGMDKEITKRLLKESGIPVSDFVVIKNIKDVNFKKLKNKLGIPMFVKPANMGSSVGVSKINTEKELNTAVKKAFYYDRKVLIEEEIKGREIECSVLGNDKPIASILGEIIVKSEFYSYKAKYIDENGAVLKIPADLPKKLSKKIRDMAIKTFKSLELEGMARIDFFLKPNGEIFVNEANTIPGFTKISMYPKLWEATGIPYSKLLDRLINLAIERYKKEKKLKTTYHI